MTNATNGDLIGHFRVGYEAVIRFPILIAPPIAVAVLGFVLFFLLGGSAAVIGAAMGGLFGGGGGVAAGGMAGFVLGVFMFGLVMAVLGLLSSAVVVVMAREALAGREPTVAEALGTVVGRLGAVVAATLLVTVVVGLGFLVFVLPGIVAAVLLVFTLPAVLLDGDGAVDAMRRSVRIVRSHPGPVIGLVAGAILIVVGIALASWLVGFVPVLGALASFVLQSAALSFLTVVAVRFYQALRTA